MKTILLTGASGDIGLPTFKELIRRNEQYKIRLLLRDSKKNRKLFKQYNDNVQIIWGDITNQDDVNKAVKDVDVILHVAAVIPPMSDKYPRRTEAVNVGGTERLIIASSSQPTKPKIIFTSSIAIYGERIDNPWISVDDPLNPNEFYADTKIEAENLIVNSGLEYVIFRLTYITKPNRKLNLETFRLMYHMPLKTSIEILDVEDTAYALVQAIDCDEIIGKIYNLAGGEHCRTNYQDYLTHYLELYGLGNNILKENGFAKRNFHCGYYVENGLQELLHFQRKSLQDHYDEVEKQINRFTRFLLTLIRPLAGWFLSLLSEPLQAQRKNNAEMIKKYFG